MCGKATEKVAHILSGCRALAQSKYLSRHDSALKVLFHEMLHDLGHAYETWYSPAEPRFVYESDGVQAYWDVSVFADHEEVRCNRVDARIVNHKTKWVITLEMSCQWVQNREKKNEEKTVKYAPPLGIKTAVPWL